MEFREGIIMAERSFLERLGWGLANIDNPEFIPTMMAKEKEAKEAEKKSALSALASDPNFLNLTPMEQQRQIAAITGDPSGLAAFAAQQADPLRKIQLAQAQASLNATQNEAKRLSALSQFSAQIPELMKGQSAVPGTPGVMGPQVPKPGMTGLEAMGRMAQITGDPTAYITALNKPPEGAQSALGKLQSDLQKGYITQEAYNAAVAKETDGGSKNIPGFKVAPGFNPSADDAKTLKTVATAKRNIDGLVEEYTALIEEEGSASIISPINRSRMQRLEAQIAVNAKELEKLGALAGPDVEVLRDMFPSATGWVTNPFTTKQKALIGMKDYKKYVNDRVVNEARQRGYEVEGSGLTGTTPSGIPFTVIQ